MILHSLVRDADVFLTNLRKSSKPRFGFEYSELSKVNPEIIHVNINGFGPNGSMSDVGGFDPMGQAISGMMYITGSDEPVLLQTIILDQMTAITASHAMLTALLYRERYGIGQEVHVSLYGSAIWMMHANLLTTSVLKQNIQVKWDRAKNPALRNSYKCRDGKWIMGTNHPDSKYWPAFCQAIEKEELIGDPSFASAEMRLSNMAELVSLLDEIMATKDRAEWLSILQAAGLLFAPVQELSDVLDDPQALINGYIIDYDHPLLGKIRIPGYPASFSANVVGPHSPAPELGEHTTSVLAELGYSQLTLEELQAANIIK